MDKNCDFSGPHLYTAIEYYYSVMVQLIFISVCHQEENLSKGILLGDYTWVI